MISILLFAILFVDQLSKFILNKTLSLSQSLPLINGVFHFTLVHNRGVAFGLLKGKAPLFIFTSLIAILLILMALKDKKAHAFDLGNKEARKNRIYRISLILILAGGIGNLIDRIILGYVVDFLDFRIWPVFNLADSAITIGAVLLGYSIIKTTGTT